MLKFNFRINNPEEDLTDEELVILLGDDEYEWIGLHKKDQLEVVARNIRKFLAL